MEHSSAPPQDQTQFHHASAESCLLKPGTNLAKKLQGERHVHSPEQNPVLSKCLFSISIKKTCPSIESRSWQNVDLL